MTYVQTKKASEAHNVDEVIRRLRWAFAAAGIRFIKTDPATGARMKTDGGAWSFILQDMVSLGWNYQALLSAPPVQLHLSMAMKALENGDAATAYYHIDRLAKADKPTEQQEMPQLPHLLMPMGVFMKMNRARISATGTVIKGVHSNE
jgi:hypothetical protein